MTIPLEQELTQAGALLNKQGRLNQIGWARQPLLDCNLEDAHFYKLRFLQPLRTKRWDYYGITTDKHFFSFTVSDIGYLGMVFAYVVDFEKQTYHEETLAIPLARGVELPRGSNEGTSRYDNGQVKIAFEATETQRTLSVRWPGFGKGFLDADISLEVAPNQESMVIVIPIEKRRFYYNRKINCLPASGWVDYNGTRYDLDPRRHLGNLDWGRGVWAYSSFWLWASASGYLPDGRRLGLNLGYGFGDNSAASENAILLDGRVHKIGQVVFEYDSRDFKRPWQMKSADGRLELTFSPFLERVAKTDALVLSSEVHQMFGHYAGRLVSDTGEVIQVSGLTGFAEEHHARW